MKLNDKVLLITGGSKGIGAAIAEASAREGAAVFVNYRQSKPEAERVVQKIRENGGNAFAIQGDVRDRTCVGMMIQEILDRCGRIDILINNAGVTSESLLFETNDADWHDVVDTNLNGVFYCTRAVIKPMMLHGWGRIINISSVLAEQPWRGSSAYAASKGAVNAFTKAAAVELAAKNITVNAIAPGLIHAGMSGRIQESLGGKIREIIPMRWMGEP